MGYCKCGCGGQTRIATQNCIRDHMVRGEPMRYLPGHFPKTLEFKQMARENHLDANNFMWRGDEVGCGAIHGWVRRRKEKPLNCERCKENAPYDLANKSGEYKRDLSDWEWICRKCHMKDDKRLEKLIEFDKNRPELLLRKTLCPDCGTEVSSKIRNTFCDKCRLEHDRKAWRLYAKKRRERNLNGPMQRL